ncbi:MAG: glutamate 5-kinase [Chlamydia sp. 32-24]|nr:MAG: glutamate 5-kinase [Chlamydia sp. 32-24]
MKEKKIVIKVGTSTLTQGTKFLSRKSMLEIARQMALIYEQGHQIVLVTSGAIAAGREVLHSTFSEQTVPTKQMLAAIGQVQLMQIWTQLFSLFNIHVGQLLLTREDLSSRKRYLNARDTVNALLNHKIIPIINENDSIATKEIRVGDNDNLAALVANLMAADLLILLTDQKGLYTKDPRNDPDAQLIPLVKKIDESIFALAKGSSTTLGTGGMTTKIEAAQKAAHCGITTAIASANHPNILLELLDGKSIGTLFSTEITPQESRKRWLLSEKRQGILFVDKGAAEKISHHGASLLPSGITKIQESFDRGAIVEIRYENKVVAVGMTNYGQEDIQKLIGKHSAKIEDILGYSYGSEIIHRTNMTRIKGE